MRHLLLAAAAIGLSVPSSAAVVVSYENPGVQNTTATFDFVGVETFESRPTGANQTFTTTFGGSAISGEYKGVRIDPANQYGSAGGTGNHAVTFTTAGYEILLSTDRPEGINYFGYWLSALDSGNKLDFFKGPDLVYSFTPTAVLNAIGGNSAYFCNPNLQFANQNCGEPYAFVNIFFKDGLTIDRIHIFESPLAGGYESDNHTVGYFLTTGGNIVPEPGTWAMLITGFGLVGAGMRRRRTAVAA